jgi:hypothetical protein
LGILLIVKWDLDNQKPMKGAATRRILELINELKAEGLCEDPLCQAQQSEEGVRGRHLDEEARVPVLEGGAGGVDREVRRNVCRSFQVTNRVFRAIQAILKRRGHLAVK